MQWRLWRHYLRTASKSNKIPHIWLVLTIAGIICLSPMAAIAQESGPVYLPQGEDQFSVFARFNLSAADLARIEALLSRGQQVRLTWRLYSLPGESLVGVWDRVLSFDPFEEQYLVKNGEVILYYSEVLTQAVEAFTHRGVLKLGGPGDYRFRVTFERYTLDPALWILSVLIPGRVDVFDQIITLGEADGEK